MKQKDTKNEHYVPVSYLANFGINGNKGRDTTSYIYNKNNNRVFESNFEIIASENKFYWIPEFEKNINILEDFFAPIESQYTTFSNILFKEISFEPSDRKSTIVSIGSETKDFLSGYFALQIVRTRTQRDYYKYIYDTLLTNIPYIDAPSYTKDDFRRIHTNSLLSMELANFYANLIMDRKWIFLINHTDIPFFTSDNPFIFISHDRTTQHYSVVATDVTGYLPITPKIAIQFFDKNDSIDDNSYFDIFSSKCILTYNSWIKHYSTRFVISNKNVFDKCFVEEKFE